MRILFVANDFPDYLQDALYHGLATLVGPENVFDHPPIGRYHGRGGSLPFAFGFPEPVRPATLVELVEAADAVVLASLRDGALDTVRQVIALQAGRPTAFVDGEDHFYVRGIVHHVDLYFKREILLDAGRARLRMPIRRWYHRIRRRENWHDPLRRHVAIAYAGNTRVIPLPFGIIDAGFVPSPEKEYDVAFVGLPTNPARAIVSQQVRALAADGFQVYLGPTGRTRMPWADYMQVLGRSRLGISVRGLGFDTYRYWEIPYAGATLLAEVPQIVIPSNFEADYEAVFAPLQDIANTARRWLATDTSAIAARGRARLLRDHTSADRAATVLQHLADVRTR